MNKPVCLGLSVLEISKILMYEFWCNYIKPKYGEKEIVLYGYLWIVCFIVYIRTGDIYKEIAEDVETNFDTSN